MPITTILFDLDDTLLDSYDARIQALHHVFQPLNIAGLTASQFLQNLKGGQLKGALGTLANNHNIKDDLFTAYRRAYWLKKPGYIRLYPGVKETLNKLHTKSFKLGIVTNKGRDFEFEGNRVGCVNELREAGIAGLFSVIVGFEDVTEQKPHPAGINQALNKLGSLARDSLYVGDSPADMESARAAGCFSCHATWGLKEGEDKIDQIQADYVIRSPEVILDIVHTTE